MISRPPIASRAIVATVRTRLGALRRIATHLGLRTRERRRQAEQLCEIAAHSDLPTVLLGDFNDWNRFQLKRGLLERAMPAFTRAHITFTPAGIRARSSLLPAVGPSRREPRREGRELGLRSPAAGCRFGLAVVA